ncbi:hypothetical protein OF83DRAFT_1175328 [Amylostereum chailletii]|nr:hypothetical protein OF83DRAFT_1175328 [Amylostereum chailletii]
MPIPSPSNRGHIHEPRRDPKKGEAIHTKSVRRGRRRQDIAKASNGDAPHAKPTKNLQPKPEASKKTFEVRAPPTAPSRPPPSARKRTPVSKVPKHTRKTKTNARPPADRETHPRRPPGAGSIPSVAVPFPFPSRAHTPVTRDVCMGVGTCGGCQQPVRRAPLILIPVTHLLAWNSLRSSYQYATAALAPKMGAAI